MDNNRLKKLDEQHDDLMGVIVGTKNDSVKMVAYDKLVVVLTEKQIIYKQQLENLKKQIK